MKLATKFVALPAFVALVTDGFQQVSDFVILFAAVVAAVAVIWRQFLKPAARMVRNAAHLYELMVGQNGFEHRLTKAEGAIDAIGPVAVELGDLKGRVSNLERLTREMHEDLRKHVS